MLSYHLGGPIPDCVRPSVVSAWDSMWRDLRQKHLDPYCVGSLPVVRLLDGSCTALPHVGWSYRSGPPRMDIDEDLVDSLIRKLGF